LITLLLIAHKLLPSPLLYLSAFFEATRDEYYRKLYNISNQGMWEDWLLYFLNGIAVQGLDVLSRAERINELINNWQAEAANLGIRSGIIQEIIKNLAVNPYCTTKKLAKESGVAFTTISRVLNKLEELGIVAMVSKGKRDKVYCAVSVLQILEEPTKITENL
jgi:Fic family protein